MIKFIVNVTHFLGIKFALKRREDGNLYVHMDQTVFSENLVHMKGIYQNTASSKSTPHCNRISIDYVSHIHLLSEKKVTLITNMIYLVCSIFCFSQVTGGTLVILTLYWHDINPNPNLGT